MQSQRLSRPTNQRMLAGVCAGLAQYVGIDVNIMRVAAVILTFVSGFATIPLYFILWLVVPQEGLNLDMQATVRANFSEIRSRAEALLDRTGLRAQPDQDWKFDPYTGQPIIQQPPVEAPQQAQQPRFDIYTGQPLDQA